MTVPVSPIGESAEAKQSTEAIQTSVMLSEAKHLRVEPGSGSPEILRLAGLRPSGSG